MRLHTRSFFVLYKSVIDSFLLFDLNFDVGSSSGRLSAGSFMKHRYMLLRTLAGLMRCSKSLERDFATSRFGEVDSLFSVFCLINVVTKSICDAVAF